MEIGPQLPPHLLSKADREKDECSEEETSKNKIEGCNDDGDNDGSYGPALPPGFKRKAIIGPCRPELPDMKSSSNNGNDQKSEHSIGPRLPTKHEEDEYLIRRKEEIESRARVSKDDKGNRPKKVVREEWMTELPPELGKNFGLGPRSFRSKEVNLGDRSVWTDTPSERENKKNKAQSSAPELREKSKKEVNMEKYVSEHNKRYRAESLLDIHQKDQKKKKKENTNSSSERRPFDRDIDLGAGQMDAAKRKSLIKQSAHLNSKFQHSKQGPTYL